MEAGMALSRRNSQLRVTLYGTDDCDQIDTSVELDRIVADGMVAALKQAQGWLKRNGAEKVTMSHHEAEDFMEGKIPDLIVHAHTPRKGRTVAVVEVDYADVTE